MADRTRTLEIRSSPHVLRGHGVDVIMFNVILALLPATAFAVYAFGLSGLLTLVTAILSCLLTEHLLTRSVGRTTKLRDGSVAITGILYGLTLPPGLPLWMVAVGGFLGVAVGKVLFGGLGSNPFNPALVGRAILQAAFPAAMTTWVPAFSADRFTTLSVSTLTPPLTEPLVDAITTATPLAAWKFGHELIATTELLTGRVSGSTGETSTILSLLGGLYLAMRKMMNWRIPASILGTVAIFSGILHLVDPANYASPLFMLCSGGLMLGAVFMATDMVGSPITHRGVLVYGIFIGVMIVVIRVWGGMPEGVMYAILFGNAITPLVDRAIRPRVFGTGGRA